MSKLVIREKRQVPIAQKILRVGPRRAKIAVADPDSAGDAYCECDCEMEDGKKCGHCGKPQKAPKAAVFHVGKAAFFASEGERMAGRVKSQSGNLVVLNLAVPNRDGILYVTETEVTVKASELEQAEALISSKRVRVFEAGMAIALDAKYTTIFKKDAEGKATAVVEDYQDVFIEGHASTFGTPDNRDRGGDYVLPGAFNNTLLEFKKNPVMLTNHDNTVEALAGSWVKIGADGVGLAVRGQVSNAPGMKDVRFKLVEGHLKGLSIGGRWYYLEDGYGIEDADLLEISLVAVPMNPDTLAQTRSLGEVDCRKAFAKFWRSNKSLKAAA